jgi:hypothetical protein
METVKFVDDGAFYVECDGPGVALYTVNKIASSATVECIVAADLDAGDYLIIPTPTTTYYAWMDITGDGTTDDPAPDGYDTDAGIQVDVSGATTAAQVATALATAIDGVTGLSAAVSDSIYVDIDVDATGACDPISDFSCGFTLTAVLGGKDENELVKSGVPNSDTSIVNIVDVTYSSTTDTLVVLAKTKTTTPVNNPSTGLVGSGYNYIYSYEAITHSDFVLG